MRTIDLNDFRQKGIGVISGHSKGEWARAQANLDKEDSNDQSVLIKVPDDVLIVNSSFFLGMFAPSISTLGVDSFNNKYDINCSERILKHWKEAVSRVLLEVRLKSDD